MQYSDELLRACGVAIICVILILTVGRMSSGVGFAIRVGGIVLIFGIFLVILKENIGDIEAMIDSGVIPNTPYLSRAFSLMIKALGITLITKLCSDICRDCGEGTIANTVDIVGRVSIVSMCIPIVSEILGYASEMLS